MNDYILYNELGRGAHTTVYKGRKKGMIDFVAICAFDKKFKDYVNNKVTILSQMQHGNVVKFIEYYETGSHFYVIEELCNGCSLAAAMQQDGAMPESLLKVCGQQLLQALYHIHASGFIVRNLHPHKIFIDSKGGVKIGGLLMGCEMGVESVVPAISPVYCCPEALIDNSWSFNSDLWSVGAILFHMYTGRQPFAGGSVEEMGDAMMAEGVRRQGGEKDIIISTDTAGFCLPGSGVDGAPLSPELHDLLTGLLEPDPKLRFTWKELEVHPFFGGQKEFIRESFYQSGRVDEPNAASVRESVMSGGVRGSVESGGVRGSVESGGVRGSVDNAAGVRGSVVRGSVIREVKQPTEDELSIASGVIESNKERDFGDETLEDSLNETGGTLKRSPSPEGMDLTESMISIPQLAHREREPAKTQASSTALAPLATPRVNLTAPLSVQELLELYQSNVPAHPIVGNPKIFKDTAPLRWSPGLLQMEAITEETIARYCDEEVSDHLVQLAQYIGSKPPVKELNNALGYLYSLTEYESCVYLIVNSGLLGLLYNLIKGGAEETQSRIIQVIGQLMHNSLTIEPEATLGECVVVLTDVLRDSSRSPLLRLYTLASLGELIFFIASQEETDGANPAWAVPNSTFVCVSRCLREGEEFTTQMCAGRVVENVCSVSSQHGAHFAQDHIALSLWKLHTKHAPTDNLQITFIRALANMTKTHQPILTHVVSKIGLVNIIDNLDKCQPSLQREMLLFLLHGLNNAKPNATCKRILADKSLLGTCVRLLSNPLANVRSFSILLLTTILSNQEAVSSACNLKLVQALDKEFKKSPEEFLMKCLTLLSSTLLGYVPTILDKVESCLQKVANRRNPNTAQIKDLNTSLTTLPVLLHLLVSKALSDHTLEVVNMGQLVDILRVLPSIQSGETGLGSPSLVEETVSSLLSIAEVCLPHCSADLAIVCIGDMCRCQNEAKGLVVQLGRRVIEHAVTTLGDRVLSELAQQHILPKVQEMLLESSPLPTLTLRMVLPLLNTCKGLKLEDHGIVTAVLELIKDCSGEDGVCTLLLETLAYVLEGSSVDMPWLYSLGLPDHLTGLTLRMGLAEPQGCVQGALEALRCLAALLKYVTSVVKRALQSSNKRSGEELLRATKPLTNVCGVLMLWYHYTTTPSVLMEIVQLYGGAYKDMMSEYHVDIFAQSMSASDEKRVKVTLKIVKRIISSESAHIRNMQAKTKGVLLTALNGVTTQSLKPLVDDITKLIKT